MVSDINSYEGFYDDMDDDGFVLIGFYNSTAEWKGLGFDFEKIEQKYPNFKCFRIDFDEAEYVRNTFGVYFTPHVLFFSERQMIDKYRYQGDHTLEDVIQKHST